MIENEIFAKHSPERQKAARQAWHMRGIDRRHGYKDNRSGPEYFVGMGGLIYLFDYIRELGSKNVLDIGAGSARGTVDLSKMVGISYDLSFVATSLARDPNISPDLGAVEYIATTAERLHGIAPSSIAGVLSMCSISYCAIPELAIHKIDEVLIPGGVFKGVFKGTRKPQDTQQVALEAFASVFGFKDYHPFKNVFDSLGYSTGFEEEDTYSRLLAIKPGRGSVNAQELLNTDLGAVLFLNLALGNLSPSIDDKMFLNIIRVALSDQSFVEQLKDSLTQIGDAIPTK